MNLIIASDEYVLYSKRRSQKGLALRLPDLQGA